MLDIKYSKFKEEMYFKNSCLTEAEMTKYLTFVSNE